MAGFFLPHLRVLAGFLLDPFFSIFLIDFALIFSRQK